MADPKRQIAYKYRIIDILNSEYVEREGWTPNYLLLDNKKVSRLNVMGIIVSKLNEKEIIIDDGSGEIPVRCFETNECMKNAEVGSIISVISKARSNNNEKYLLAEILKKIENKDWMEFRKVELGIVNAEVVREDVVEGESVEKPVEDTKTVNSEIKLAPAEQLLEFIKQNDKGEGVDFNEMYKIENSEKIIQNLLQAGDIFEIQPGRFKVLD